MRKKTAKSIFDFEKSAELDFESYLKPYEDVKSELQNHLYFIKNKVQKLYAFRVIYKDDLNLLYIVFAKNKTDARKQANRYLKENFYEPFMENSRRDKYTPFVRLHPKRLPDFDKYAEEKLVPIPEILKLGIKLPCSFCGKHHFTLTDYDNNRCFIVEGEGNMTPFIKGLLACYECKRKYLS